MQQQDQKCLELSRIVEGFCCLELDALKEYEIYQVWNNVGVVLFQLRRSRGLKRR